MALQTLPQKIGDAITGLATAAHGVGLEHHRNQLAASRRRVRDSHVAQAKAAGFEPLPAGEGEEVGDLTVTGDVQIVQAPPKSKIPAVLAGAALAAALGAVALGVFNYLSPPPTGGPTTHTTEGFLIDFPTEE